MAGLTEGCYCPFMSTPFVDTTCVAAVLLMIGACAGVQVLLHDAQRVLHRHVVTGKRHHPPAKLQMQGMKRGFQDFGVSRRVGQIEVSQAVMRGSLRWRRLRRKSFARLQNRTDLRPLCPVA